MTPGRVLVSMAGVPANDVEALARNDADNVIPLVADVDIVPVDFMTLIAAEMGRPRLGRTRRRDGPVRQPGGQVNPVPQPIPGRCSELQLTAYHEGGHAVIAQRNRRKFFWVSVRSDETTAGHVVGARYVGEDELAEHVDLTDPDDRRQLAGCGKTPSEGSTTA